MSWKPKLWHVLVATGIVFVGGLVSLVCALVAFGGTTPMDNKFGDQYLKTAVALLELHRSRFGKYPSTLADLTYIGDWDPIALGSVRYCPNAARTEYFVDVTRGWIGRPHLTYGSTFWTGTGYRASLVSTCP